MMQDAVLKVIREGDRWGVAADGELLATARTKKGAQTLAREAAEILSASGARARVEVQREPRSFKNED
jgi:archaeosine-15-forming tRNA-guanine transglycosylase